MVLSEEALTSQMVQQQIANDPNAIYADTLREDKVSNFIQQINPDNLLVDIEHRIRGEKKNTYTQQWEPIAEGQVPVSEELIVNFVSFLGSILNQNTSLSHFTAPEINNIMEIIIEYIKDDLTDNDEKYGIVGNYTEMSRIGNILAFSVFATLKQALNGNLARRIFSSLKVSASLTDEKKGGIKEAIQFWK